MSSGVIFMLDIKEESSESGDSERARLYGCGMSCGTVVSRFGLVRFCDRVTGGIHYGIAVELYYHEPDEVGSSEHYGRAKCTLHWRYVSQCSATEVKVSQRYERGGKGTTQT